MQLYQTYSSVWYFINSIHDTCPCMCVAIIICHVVSMLNMGIPSEDKIFVSKTRLMTTDASYSDMCREEISCQKPLCL
jgi:hypothetical protein